MVRFGRFSRLQGEGVWSGLEGCSPLQGVCGQVWKVVIT